VLVAMTILKIVLALLSMPLVLPGVLVALLFFFQLLLQ
jgi:hypothetical protein